MELNKDANTKVPESYTESLKGDSRASKYRARVVLNVLENRSVSQDASVVDVGCGYGILLDELKEEKYTNIKGVEPINEVVENLKSRGLEACVGDLEKGVDEIGDASVDVVTCLEVLEHLYDPQSALVEINRWLRPGGILIASVPNAYRLNQRLRMVTGQTTSDVALVGGHIKFFDWDTFPSMVEKAGFDIEQQFGEGGLRMRKIVPKYMKLLHSFPRLLAKWIFVAAIKK